MGTVEKWMTRKNETTGFSVPSKNQLYASLTKFLKKATRQRSKRGMRGMGSHGGWL